MSQVDNYQFPPGTISGEAVLTRIENVFGAVGSGNLGASAPSNPFNGMTWIDTSEAPVWTKHVFTPEGWIPLTAVNITTGAVTPYIGDTPAERQSSSTDTTPGRLPVLHDIGGGVGALGGGIIQGGVLREIVFIPYDVDPGDLPTDFTKDSAGQVTWDTTAFPWLKFVVSELQSAGGGGGSAEGGSGSAEGAGGGGGAWSSKKIDVSNLSTSEVITLGAPGMRGLATGSPNNGDNGGASSFGPHHSATGGAGGSGGPNAEGSNGGQGGAGGNATGGDINIDGRRGNSRRVVSGNAVFANYGGTSPVGGGNFGDGGRGGISSVGGSNTAGNDGLPSYQVLYLFG